MGGKKKKRGTKSGNEPQLGHPALSAPNSSWTTYQRTQRVTSTTLILKVDGLVDPFAVAERPEDYLLDIFEHDAEAADLWHRRRLRDDWWNEGVVQLRYQETKLIEASSVDDVLIF